MAGESEAESKTMAADLISFETELARLFKDAQHERTATQNIYALSMLDALSPALGVLSGCVKCQKRPMSVKRDLLACSAC